MSSQRVGDNLETKQQLESGLGFFYQDRNGPCFHLAVSSTFLFPSLKDITMGYYE